MFKTIRHQVLIFLRAIDRQSEQCKQLSNCSKTQLIHTWLYSVIGQPPFLGVGLAQQSYQCVDGYAPIYLRWRIY